MAGPEIISSSVTFPEVLKMTRLKTTPLTCAARAIGGYTTVSPLARPVIVHQRVCAIPAQHRNTGATKRTMWSRDRNDFKILARSYVLGGGSAQAKFAGEDAHVFVASSA